MIDLNYYHKKMKLNTKTIKGLEKVEKLTGITDKQQD